MHANSKLLFEKYVRPVLKDGMRILEIGPDAFPSTFQCLSGDVSFFCWDTLDINENPNLTYQNCNEHCFQVEPDSHDVVLSGQVIEHVRKPWRWVPELARVTKPGCLVITIGPVSWTYHEAPVDCWRIYPEGMRSLYEEAGLTILLSRWESLETPDCKRDIPGISRAQQGLKERLLSTIFGVVGLPVEQSYDTVTIGKKEITAKE
jgi:hypothetical protein